MKILIADDDPVSRAVIKVLIMRWGHEVVETDCGSSALEQLLAPAAPAIAILDWRMPGLTGVDVCQKVRSSNLEFPPYLIVLTGMGDRAHRIEALHAGADDFLAKPLDTEELSARMGTAERIIRLQTRLIMEARTDPLTGLSNRKGILLRLEQEMDRAQRNQGTLAVGMLDLDRFKLVNDTWGHPVGDEVLMEFASRIHGTLRIYDSIGRFGGEEFLVLLPNGANDLPAWDRMRTALSVRPITTKTGPVPLTVSMGVSHYIHGESESTLLERVDKALYQAKANGRNCVVIAEPQDLES